MVPENARELLESLAREHGALNTGADPAVPLWILTLALRALDYAAASGEVTEWRDLFRQHGGRFHGPHTETAYCEEQAFWRFVGAIRRKALEEAAGAVRPKNPRPCDCDICDCRNSGDLAAVTAWDQRQADAAAIRALGRPA